MKQEATKLDPIVIITQVEAQRSHLAIPNLLHSLQADWLLTASTLATIANL